MGTWQECGICGPPSPPGQEGTVFERGPLAIHVCALSKLSSQDYLYRATNPQSFWSCNILLLCDFATVATPPRSVTSTDSSVRIREVEIFLRISRLHWRWVERHGENVEPLGLEEGHGFRLLFAVWPWTSQDPSQGLSLLICPISAMLWLIIFLSGSCLAFVNSAWGRTVRFWEEREKVS